MLIRMEENTTMTGFSGGIPGSGRYVAAGAGMSAGGGGADVQSRMPITLDIDGANPTELIITATRFGSGSDSTVGASVMWREFR